MNTQLAVELNHFKCSKGVLLLLMGSIEQNISAKTKKLNIQQVTDEMVDKIIFLHIKFMLCSYFSDGICKIQTKRMRHTFTSIFTSFRIRRWQEARCIRISGRGDDGEWRA